MDYETWNAIERERLVNKAKATPCKECEHCIPGEVKGMPVGWCTWCHDFLSEEEMDDSIYNNCPDLVD